MGSFFMKPSTLEWLRKADDDRAVAKKLARGKQPLHDGICFHCQQCVEKLLKALLEELGLHIAKTHDLEKILEHLSPTHPFCDHSDAD